jgi:hypothetical protein
MGLFQGAARYGRDARGAREALLDSGVDGPFDIFEERGREHRPDEFAAVAADGRFYRVSTADGRVTCVPPEHAREFIVRGPLRRRPA